MSTESTTEQTTQQGQRQSGIGLLVYFLLGIGFGIVLTKSEVISWFRVQEMFRFQSPQMYEIIASAVVTAAASVAFIKKVGLKTISGEPIAIPPRLWETAFATLLGAQSSAWVGRSPVFVPDRCSPSWATVSP